MEHNLSSVCCQGSSADAGLVSYEFRAYFTFIFIGVGSMLLSLLGLFTNTISLIVFYRQGLKDGVTISLCSLAFSDLLISVGTAIMGLTILFDRGGLLKGVVDWTGLMGTTGWPRSMCVNISTYTTAFVTVERSLCVILPFKFKRLITRTRAIICCAIIYVVFVAAYSPLLATVGLSWQWNESTNTTMLLQWFSPDRMKSEKYFQAIVEVTAPLVGFFAIIFATYFMISRLRMSADFRRDMKRVAFRPRGETSTAGNEIQDSEADNKLVGKDKKVVRMVSLVAVVFILCTTPLVVVVIARRIVVDLRAGGKYENFMWVMFSVVYLAGGVNASANMFIYIKASSKFKEIFYQTFCRSPRVVSA